MRQQGKSRAQLWLERAASFWAMFGLGYLAFRYIFHAGHLASSLAYIDAGISAYLYPIYKRVHNLS